MKLFKQLQRQKRRPRLIIRTGASGGRFHIEGLGAWHSYWREPYHLLLTIP